MKILGWYSLILMLISLASVIGSDSEAKGKTSGTAKLIILLLQVPTIIYIAKTLGLM